ncbi:MAG: phosphoribosylformylglycinamidine cyclo-ligase [Myxococcales bacterium]|nr:phosphoribosylformylglycinamidine cyclo-ligase [Myxococcales bacterium]
MASGLDYRAAGVDIDAGEALVERIKPLAAATRIPEAITDLGGFAALCELPSGMRAPVMVSGTDGVGTKLLVAHAANRHDTVGIDLVAMCVNDIITTGARPLFFLDYMATGTLDVDQASQVIAGIAEGCKQAGCALLGGETAEHPGEHATGRYDLAGFAVGVVERDAILPRKDVAVGDVLLGLRSSGLHSNGYSLARKALLERRGLALDERVESLGEPLVETLLRPTRIYARALSAALAAGQVKAACHVTGGGLPGNLPRVLPDETGAAVDMTGVERHPIFDLVQEAGEVETAEMYRAFNMGVGLVLIVPAVEANQIARAVSDTGEQVTRLGEVIPAPHTQGDARVQLCGT